HLVSQSCDLGQRFLPSLFDSFGRYFIWETRKHLVDQHYDESTELVQSQVVEALNMLQAVVINVFEPQHRINRFPHRVLGLEILAMFQNQVVQLLVDDLPWLLHCLQFFTGRIQADPSEHCRKHLLTRRVAASPVRHTWASMDGDDLWFRETRAQRLFPQPA